MNTPGQFDYSKYTCKPYSSYSSGTSYHNGTCSDYFSYDSCMRSGCNWEESTDGTGVNVPTKMYTCNPAPVFSDDLNMVEMCGSITDKNACLGTGKCLFTDCRSYKAETNDSPQEDSITCGTAQYDSSTGMYLQP